MTGEAASAHLWQIVEQCSEKVRKPKSTVLFRRGDKASGMFVVLRGTVSLDLGMDPVLARSYGAGALVGLPSALTRQNYSTTATVTEEARLGFLSSDGLESLLRNNPDLCLSLLVILGEKIAESREDERALLSKGRAPDVALPINPISPKP